MAVEKVKWLTLQACQLSCGHSPICMGILTLFYLCIIMDIIHPAGLLTAWIGILIIYQLTNETLEYNNCWCVTVSLISDQFCKTTILFQEIYWIWSNLGTSWDIANIWLKLHYLKQFQKQYFNYNFLTLH